MRDAYRMVGEIVKAMQDAGCPTDRAMRAEAAILTVVVNSMRPVAEAQEAARLLPYGATTAASALGVHRATVYRRARRRNLPDQIATAD